MASSILPETSCYSLEQIAQRWGCDTEQLIRYCETSMLNIGVLIHSKEGHDVSKNFKKIELLLNGFFHLSQEDILKIWHTTPEDYHYIDFIHLPEEALNLYNSQEDSLLNGACILLKNKHPYSQKDLRISKEERDRFEKEHGIDTNKTDHKDIPRLSPNFTTQENREIILREYLVEKRIDTTNQIELTQSKLWDALHQIDNKLFPPASDDTIKQFFKVQDICRFKIGRRKSG